MLTAEVVEGFVNSVLAKGFDDRAETPECHREWWDFCTSVSRFVAIAAPRGFAKSTAITHSYTLAAMLFRTRKFALIISDTETQAILFLQDIKKELQDNEDLTRLFNLKQDRENKVVFAKETESDIIVEFVDGYQFRIIAKGSEQKVRGIKWGHQRPDLIVCDDLENDEIVLNKERREKFRKWFYGALLPSRSDDGIIRVVGTILHMDSLLERLMPENQLQTKKQRKFLIQEELKEYTDVRTPWKSIKYKAHNKDFSHLLWKEKKSAEELKTIREQYIAEGIPEVYSQEYLNIPIDESTAYFKRLDFLHLTEEDRKKQLRYYITVDLAISEKQKADYSVFLIAGVDENRRIHVKSVIRERLDGREIVDMLISLQRIYRPEVIGVEESQISKSIGPFLNEAMLSMNEFINLYPLKHMSLDKQARTRSIQARMRAQTVKFDKDLDWYQTFEDECAQFPRAKHDDQVDAFAYLGLMLDKLLEAPTQIELREELYQEELIKSDFLEQGRNDTTGY